MGESHATNASTGTGRTAAKPWMVRSVAERNEKGVMRSGGLEEWAVNSSTR